LHNKLHYNALMAKPNQRYDAWKKYFSFKENHLLLKDIRKNDDSIMIKKDLDYGYGLTIHKTQGSTYGNILINLRDIVYTKYGTPVQDKVLRNKLIYVALSRAKNKAILYL
jgi:hypothetical protein